MGTKSILLPVNNEFGLHEEAGWEGCFTRQRAPEALANGTRVIKVKGEPKDETPDGVKGVVLGSLKIPERPETLYFVEWDDKPKVAMAAVGWKLQELH